MGGGGGGGVGGGGGGVSNIPLHAYLQNPLYFYRVDQNRSENCD